MVATAPRKAAPKPKPVTTAAMKSSRRRGGEEGGEGARDADGEDERADQQRPLGRRGAQGERADDAGAVEREDQQPADQVVVDAEDVGDQRGAERGVEPAERPAGDQDRQRDDEGPAVGGRHVHPRAERGHRAGQPR